MHVARPSKLVAVDAAPRGLSEGRLEDAAVVARALQDVEALLARELKGQIASNQHCYVNLPHPLTVHNYREAFVPLLPWGHERVAGIEELFAVAVKAVGFEGELDDLKRRANVIVREYRRDQHIPFHFDDLECSELVLGIVLLNEAPGTGLCFRKGEDNSVMQYVVKEDAGREAADGSIPFLTHMQGTVFSLEGESRYSWSHGLPPCRGRRISITCRFYKPDVIDKWRKDMAALPEDEPLPAVRDVDAAAPATVNVSLCDGRNPSVKKAVLVPSHSSHADVIKLFKQKLRIKVSKIALDKGREWPAGEPLCNGAVLHGFP